jgi:hypothetical protein
MEQKVMKNKEYRPHWAWTLLAIFIVAAAVSIASPAKTKTHSLKNSSSSEIILTSFWSLVGDDAGAEFAYTATTAGDVNNDGFGDLLLGSPRYSSEEYPGGAVFVYYGKAQGLPDSANWSYGGSTQGDRFGSAASSAGDVNNDGYDDIIIGAYRYRNNKAEDGCAYLFLGSPTGLEEYPAWTHPFEGESSHFGYSVAGAGDVNKDGFDDVLIGARYYSFGETNEGAAFLFLGNAGGLENSPRWMYESNQLGAGLGSSVAGVDDVNQDGYADILIGAPQYTLENEQEGAALLFLGSEIGSSPSPDLILTGNRPETGFGTSVSGAGDVNNDGYPDVIVGAPTFRRDLDQIYSQGAAFLFYGTTEGLQQASSWQAYGDQNYPEFGISVSSAGDVNGDDIDDLVVGAHLLDDDQPDEGGIYVYLGSINGPGNAPAFRAFGDKAEASLGFDAHSAGDINKDGLDDIIVGAPWYRSSEVIYGRAFLYSGQLLRISSGSEVYIPIIVTR